MNQNQIQQLTSHLSQALDQNYDVVNMEAVLSVICALEGTTITKEQLEATRLAKYINQLRRRTKNEQLARRAKSLLKKWREMVGIQQNVIESQPQSHLLSSVSLHQQQQQQHSSDFVKTDLDQVSIHLPLSPTQQIIHAETQHLSDVPVHHTSFSNLVNNVQRENKNILRRHESPSIANTENEPSVVIDIASDSDETDHNSSAVALSKRENVQNSKLANPIPIPTPSPRQKKLKKAKKHKEKGVQSVRGFNLKVAETLSQADSEIFSLSNSSVSSIFSAEATTTMGNSQHNKQRINASELTFTGRFKSVSSLNNNSAGNETVRKNSGKYDDYNNMYDSSGASCSRLSPLNIEDNSRKIETKIDANLHQTVLLGNNDLENTTSQSRLHLPKKRGRKRGSKGVDTLIAKESSTSLSQQIFFGQGSTVKKVKTTKELFNEIQSRKLSVSTTSNLSSSSTTNRIDQVTTVAAMFPRPTSSCSDTSIHSPQIMETYSGNGTLMGVDTFSVKLDAANTDSDTVTSEPSRDSNKSQEIKGTSLDNSNSNSFAIFDKINLNMKKENLNDITTQLMHLIHSLKSPLSVYEIEQMYLAELVPCSCVIMEDDDKNTLKGEPENTTNDNIAISLSKSNLDADNNRKVHMKDKKHILPPVERLDNDHEIVENQLKPVKSIFDLDFDDDNDDLRTIMLETKPVVKMEERKKNLEVPNVSELDINYNQELERERSERIAANLPIIPTLIVQEDPNCLAKQRFYVQTNQVTSFHINALHNYYIPNINGNWDDIDNSAIQPWDSLYSVTDGADVVPKYDFIASDRIKKDLSSLKFLKPFKAKPFKSLIAPFLGVAKYLPTCRRAKRKLKISFNRLSKNPGKNVLMEMPLLNVNIDVMDRSHNEYAGPIKILRRTSSSYDNTSSRYSVPDIPKSNNLLKLVNDQVQWEADEIQKEKNNDGNDKNFNIKTCDNNSSSGSDSEDKNENDYENNEEYAIVQRPTTTSHDHIVLTIKKTPSKINSPANSIITTMPPQNFTTMNLPTTITSTTSSTIPTNAEGNLTVPGPLSVPLTKGQLTRQPFRPHRYRYRYSKHLLNAKTLKVASDHKNIFNLKETDLVSDITMREKLFFQHELYGEHALGIKEEILNYTSSSCDEESEVEGGESEAKSRSTITPFDNNRYNLQSETDTREDKLNSDDSLVLSSSDEDTDDDDESLIFQDAQHDLENNSLLKSFNSIQTDSQNDFLNGSNKYCNNNHLETHTEISAVKKWPVIGLEYRTGYRSLSDVNGTTPSTTSYQEFKEWHQVLQLKSYNNEPLIVLPYVVLE